MLRPVIRDNSNDSDYDPSIVEYGLVIFYGSCVAAAVMTVLIYDAGML